MTSGCDPQRPVALIRWGTKGSQETLVGTVQNIAHLARVRGFKPPVVTVVGEVVNLREHLNWFETKPLFGRRIVITRPRSQAGSFAERIEDLGGEVVEFPTIEILPPQSYAALDEAIQNIGRYHWIIFTSVNGVRYFFSRYLDVGRDIRDLSGIKIATIGPETARELHRQGIRPDLMPGEYTAEALLEHLKCQAINGRRVLLPRTVKARDVLPQTLGEWGAQVDVVEAYRTARPKGEVAWLRSMLLSGMIDMITFTSSSTVANFTAQFPGENLKELVSHVRIACIGPITQKTAEELGMRVAVSPREYTIPALTEAILHYFTEVEVTERPR
jgi:uroporphyrinogen III methyltransferase/synthase